MRDRPDSPRPSVAVEVSNTQAHLAVDPAWIARVVVAALAAEDVAAANISVVLTDDASIRVINRRHLSHDWATDVISFRLDDESEEILSGELVISVEMASNTARRLARDPADELALYLVHGLLHLCGYDDRASDDVTSMRRREAEILAALRLGVDERRLADVVADGTGSDREILTWPV